MREVPLLRCFVVNLGAPSTRLVVEVDSESHAERRAAEARPDGALRSGSIACFGFSAEFLFRMSNPVETALAAALVSRRSQVEIETRYGRRTRARLELACCSIHGALRILLLSASSSANQLG